jgi:fructan beta-fructosidase
MNDIYRPEYHFTPPSNWMNDPNGLVYLDGEYHLFYQYHPHSAVWGPMHWGHAVSRDLVNWTHLPIALYPDENGMIFSGSAVVDWNNTAGFGEKALVAIFTYNKDHKETQNIAYSTDKGRTWTKYASNPVIPHPEAVKDFRDPKVFWHKTHWVMSLAAGDKILFYESQNLKSWQHTGSFGGGYGCVDGVWETPDLFELPVENSGTTRWVLTVGVSNGAPAGGSGTQYFIGDFDGKTFTSENSKDTVLWADYGADYYAPQSWSDEPNARRLMIGWMSNWQYAVSTPTETWRGAFSLIREVSLIKTENGIRLAHKPISELQHLRNEHYHWQSEIIQPESNLLEEIYGKALEIMAEFQIASDVKCFGFRVRAGADEHTDVSYIVEDKTLRLNRAHSGKVDFADIFAAVHSAELPPIDNVIRLHLFIDSSSIEVFANDGLVVFSDCIFPSDQSQGLQLFAEGGSVTLNSLDVYQLNPAKFSNV